MDGQYPPPVDEEPTFSIYGLDSASYGLGWMEAWGRLPALDRARSAGGEARYPGEDGPLWYISLGHGDPPSSYVVVVTVPKQTVDYGDYVTCAGVVDAARMALLEMLPRAFPQDDQGQRASRFHEEAARVPELAGRLTEPEWSPEPGIVEDEPVTVWVRAIADVWAAVIDRADVAIGVYGAGTVIARHRLVPVNEYLHSYTARGRPGSDVPPRRKA